MKNLFLVFFLIIIGCQQNNSTPRKVKSLEGKNEQSKKKEDISQLLTGGIYSKNQIKDCFLDFKFGDSKSVVSSKTKKYLRIKKLAKKPPYSGAQFKSLLYNFKLRESTISFAVFFEFTNKNELYKVVLGNISYPGYPGGILNEEFEEIVSVYKEKYKTKWYFDKYLRNNSNMVNFEFYNLEGNRYISINHFSSNVSISYTNLTLEENFKKDNLNSSKKDI